MLFAHQISGLASWGSVFQSAEAWRPLVMAIYQREGMPCTTLGQLTPGSNAVFRVDQTVIKIFAPPEAGISDVSDYANELTALREAKALSVAVPEILAHGVFADRYQFEYLIMTYIPGKDIGDILHNLNPTEQDNVLKQVKEIVNSLQRGEAFQHGMDFLINRARSNRRWRIYNSTVQQEVAQYLNRASFDYLVRVHCDMTGENLLLDEHGKVYLIDFADSCIAPPEYEYPALIFELLDLDVSLVQRFFNYMDSALFITTLFPAILLHDFGADYLRKATERLLHCSAEQVQSLAVLETALIRYFAANTI